MLFGSWEAVGRILVVGVLAYAALVLLLRGFGKRSLAKMNAFDFVVTVALGSILASVVVSKDVPLADGLAAFAVLLVAQYAVSWASVRWAAVRRAVKSEPTLLLFQGRLLPDALRAQRVNAEEVRAVLRGHGMARVEDAYAVVLETDGSFSVLSAPSGGPATALRPDVSALPDLDDGPA